MSSSPISSSNSNLDPGYDEAAVSSEAAAPPDGRQRLDTLLRRFGNVRLRVACDVGTATMTLRALLALKEGSVVTAARTAGDDLALGLNGMMFGRADVMVADTKVLLRITEIVDA